MLEFSFDIALRRVYILTTDFSDYSHEDTFGTRIWLAVGSLWLVTCCWLLAKN